MDAGKRSAARAAGVKALVIHRNAFQGELMRQLAIIATITLLLGGCSSPPPVGYELRYRPAPLEGQEPDLKQVVDAIQNRVANLGEVTVQEGKIVVGVYGNDPVVIQRIKDRLRRAGTLEFRILANNLDHEIVIKMAKEEVASIVRDAAGEPLAKWVPIAKKIDTDELAIAYIPEGAGDKWHAVRTSADGEVEILVILDPFDVRGEYLSRVYNDRDIHGAPAIGFAFNPEGAYRFGSLTSENCPVTETVLPYKRDLAVILDGDAMTSATINERITDRGIIQGDFDLVEVEDICAVLNAGSMPCMVELVSEQKVKPAK